MTPSTFNHGGQGFPAPSILGMAAGMQDEIQTLKREKQELRSIISEARLYHANHEYSLVGVTLAKADEVK